MAQGLPPGAFGKNLFFLAPNRPPPTQQKTFCRNFDLVKRARTPPFKISKSAPGPTNLQYGPVNKSDQSVEYNCIEDTIGIQAVFLIIAERDCIYLLLFQVLGEWNC